VNEVTNSGIIQTGGHMRIEGSAIGDNAAVRPGDVARDRPRPAEPPSAVTGIRIFLNYRNEDEPFGAALVDHELSTRFGSERVFRASKSIKLGEDFADAILSAVRRSTALLVLIGPRWLKAADSRGIRRLDDPDDWVRQEIAEALRHEVRVIPILLNTDLPRPGDLPEDIAQLVRGQYLRIHHRNSRRDIRRLIDELAELLPELTTESQQPDH
jgi:hypothetical protein